jgi:hypothetical protein
VGRLGAQWCNLARRGLTRLDLVCGQGVLSDEVVLDTEGRAILISRATADPSFYTFMTEGAGLPVFNPVPAAPGEAVTGVCVCVCVCACVLVGLGVLGEVGEVGHRGWAGWHHAQLEVPTHCCCCRQAAASRLAARFARLLPRP